MLKLNLGKGHLIVFNTSTCYGYGTLWKCHAVRISLIPRLSACNIEKLGIGPGNKASARGVCALESSIYKLDGLW